MSGSSVLHDKMKPLQNKKKQRRLFIITDIINNLKNTKLFPAQTTEVYNSGNLC